MKITNETIDVISRVVEAIAPDAMDMCESNDELIEMAIDANRPSTFCGTKGEEAEAEITALIKEHGYELVLEHLSKHRNLQFI
jgi:hypothetical protein